MGLFFVFILLLKRLSEQTQTPQQSAAPFNSCWHAPKSDSSDELKV